MNFNLTKTALIIIALGILGMILILFIAAFVNYINIRKLRIKQLKYKEQEILKNISKLYVKQVNALNGMLSTGLLTPEDFKTKKKVICKDMKELHLDTSAISAIPQAEYVSAEELNKKRMKMALLLLELGELSDSEFEKHINDSLDSLK